MTISFPSGLLAEAAPAKINLFLHITGRRDDGYHLLESLFIFGGVADQLQAEAAADLSLRVVGPFAPAIPATSENLVLRAARALHKAAPATGSRGARLTLHKNLPVAAGLGGGSADAAAALRLLSKLWQVDIGEGALHDLALELGADVPACLDSKAKLVSGIGEILHPLSPLPPLYLLLVNPGVSLSTARVFAERAQHCHEFTAPGMPDLAGVSAERLIESSASCRNDLEVAACTLEPEIAGVIAELAQQPGCRISRMSGSGATCFGLFVAEEEAQDAAAHMAAAHPGWWLWSGAIRL